MYCMRILLLTIMALAILTAKDKPTYPEHGTVLSMRKDVAETFKGETDLYGNVSGKKGYARVKIPVYKVQTDTMTYEVEGKLTLPVGGTIAFRIEKDRMYVQDGHKEKKYSIVGEETRSR
jgi:hypothetical protein